MDWVRGVKLGHGCFATVNLAASTATNSNLPPLMAVKSCGFLTSSSLMNEKLILDELRDCPEIVRCFGETVSYENGEKLYNVLLEYASGGDLARKLKSSGDGRLPELDVRRYTKALLRGLDYIHRVGIVHCDVKLQNILLGENGAVKIADFGLAKRVEQNGAVSGCEVRGTPLYMSPEMVSGGEVGTAADIWAVGCVVAEMAAGSPAWRRATDVAGLLLRIGSGDELPEIPEGLSAEGKDFLGKCFVKDPTQRWTAEMLLRHPFICDQNLEDRTETTTSPRCIFDFPDWATCSITSLPSESSAAAPPELSSGSWSEGRLLDIICKEDPNWSVADDWVTVR